MTPREPDRFETKAKAVVEAVIDCMNGRTDHAGCGTGDGVDHIAAALRAAESEALERAARAFDERGPRLLSGYETARCLRYPYVASPAAAPAAETVKAPEPVNCWIQLRNAEARIAELEAALRGLLESAGFDWDGGAEVDASVEDAVAKARAKLAARAALKGET